MKLNADIDIDFADRELVLRYIKHIPASINRNDEWSKHNTGVYVNPIPADPFTNISNIDYQTAEERGYFKIDFLNMHVYKLVQSPEHYQTMLAATPPWQRLWIDGPWASQLVHVGNYTDLLAEMKPDSIPRMAAFIAIIRPGKAHLQTRPWAEVFDSVWDGDSSKGFVFKKAHAIGYAKLVALHMNLLNSANESN